MLRLFPISMLALALLLLPGCGDGQKPYTGPALPYTPEPPKPKLPNPQVKLETSEGDIELELFEDDKPNTVANFISLVEKPFYNGTVFHRIMKDRIIQGGDPMGTGQGGPGYKFPDEIRGSPNSHDQYALSMHNTGPNTNGSQFSIITAEKGAHDLDRKQTVFGKVIKGKDVVAKLNAVPIAGERPINPPKLISAKVLSKREHPYDVRNKLMDPVLPTPPQQQPPGPVKIQPQNPKPNIGIKPGPTPAPVQTPKPDANKPAEPKPAVPEVPKTGDNKKPEEKKPEEKKPDEKKPN